MAEGFESFAPRKLTHQEGRREQALYWGGKTAAERLVAAAALRKGMYQMRGIDIDEQEADFTPRWVVRRKS